jgi:hypothetical protein
MSVDFVLLLSYRRIQVHSFSAISLGCDTSCYLVGTRTVNMKYQWKGMYQNTAIRVELITLLTGSFNIPNDLIVYLTNICRVGSQSVAA